MNRFLKRSGIVLILLALLLAGCEKNESNGEDSSDKETVEVSETETETETDDDTETDEESKTETETESDTETESETEEEIKSIDLNGYTIVRGEHEDEAIIGAIGEVYTAFFEKDIEVNFGVDIDTPKTEKEIRVGATDRSEDKNLRYSDYSIEYKD